MRWLKQLLLFVLPALVFVMVWEAIVWNDSRRQFLFASPSLVVKIAVEELFTPSIWNDMFITCSEALLGLSVGSLIGTIVGLLLWTKEGVARVARPYVVILGSIPIFAVAPMLIIWFGIGLLSKIVMAAFAVFFVSLSQAYDGAAYCAREHGHYARTLSAPQRLIMLKIIVPGALRWVIAGLKISIGLALVGAFIGEFVSSQAGLGHYILTAGSLYDMPRVLFGVFLISSVALALTGLLWLFERWKPQYFAK